MKSIIRVIAFGVMFISITFGNQINILYTANINATFDDCNCGNNPLGGINRIKTYFDEFRNNNKNTLYIDGGNFFNSYKYPELNRSALNALTLLQYDLITPGFHIFSEDKDFFNYNSVINSNIIHKIESFKDFNFNGIKIRFFAFLSPKLFKYSEKPDWLELNTEINNIEYLQDGINILIFNGYKTDAENFLKQHNNFDILLLSYDQQKGIWKHNNTSIIGGGHDAESIALVEIYNVDSKRNIDLKYVDMDESIKPSNQINQIFKNYNSDLGKEKKI